MYVHTTYYCSKNATIVCWTDSQTSLVKGSFYYGYLILQVGGGRLAEVYGTRRVMGIAMISCAVLTFISPVAALWNVWSLVAIRVAIGIAQVRKCLLFRLII